MEPTKYGPKGPLSPTLGERCRICGVAFVPGDFTSLMRQTLEAKYANDAFEVHWECAARHWPRGTKTSCIGSHETATAAGMLAARNWLDSRTLWVATGQHWDVEILLDVVDGRARESSDEPVHTQFRLCISTDQWDFSFWHGGLASRIRIVHVPRVDGRDDFGLLARTPPLKDIRLVIRALEAEHRIQLRRHDAIVDTDIPNGEPEIRRWIESL